MVERNGEPIARIGPLVMHTAGTALEGLRAWRAAAREDDDPGFADDLARVVRADRPPRNPWE